MRNKTVHGASVGVLMLTTKFPRPLGDLGNAESFPFPVLFHAVPGASPERVVRDRAEGLEEAFAEGARHLVALGADGVMGCCGFLALHQEMLAEAAGVPVVASSLVQQPMVERMLPPGQRAGILTISAADLGQDHLAAAGCTENPPVAGVDEAGDAFSGPILEDREEMDFDAASRDVVEAARMLVRRRPETGAIVMECTNLSSYAPAIREATGLPVLTPCNLLVWFQGMLRPRRF